MVAAGALVALAAGCTRSGAPGQTREQPVRVESFSEAAPVRAIAVIPPYAFSASRNGLDRWNLGNGQSLHLSAEHGLPGDRVAALSYDSGRGWLWIATDQGVTRYEVQSGAFAEIPPPPMVLGLLPLNQVVIEPAGDGGLWLGNQRGLFYTNPDGQWTDTLLTEPVTALLRTRDGWLWVGTAAGLVGRHPEGETYRYGPEQGCDIQSVRFLAGAPGDVALAVGENDQGQQRIALMLDGQCASYQAGPDQTWLSAARRGDELVILTADRLYALFAAEEGGPPVLPRNGMRLVPVARGDGDEPRPSPYKFRALEGLDVPPGARIVAAADNEILVGTRSLGTVRLPIDAQAAPRSGAADDDAQGGERQWLRRGELVQDAIALTVACKGLADCYVGTGRNGWHWDGQGFTAIDHQDGEMLAFARSQDGEIYAVVREVNAKLRVKRFDVDSSWIQVAGVAMETPGSHPSVSFARFAPNGKLWLGLRYRDGDGDVRPYGGAEIDVSLGLVTYHGTRIAKRQKRQESLRVPMDLTDVAFFEDEEIWLASTDGAAQIRGRKVKVHGETQGLKTQMLRGIAVAPGGVVFVAGRPGVGAWDGASWTYPQSLEASVNDVEIGLDGRLWMATRRGLGVFDGARVRWFDVRRGLLENQIDEAVADSLGRIWVRGSQGISLLTP